MSVAEYFRELARRCRTLSNTASEPVVMEQMRVWTVDFAMRPTKRSGMTVKRECHPEGGEDRRHRSEGLSQATASFAPN